MRLLAGSELHSSRNNSHHHLREAPGGRECFWPCRWRRHWEPIMTKLYPLLAKAQLDGEVRQPGYVFTLAEGERGPHRAAVASNIGGMAWRHSKELTRARLWLGRRLDHA
jgi:hypothetical protein